MQYIWGIVGKVHISILLKSSGKTCLQAFGKFRLIKYQKILQKIWLKAQWQKWKIGESGWACPVSSCHDSLCLSGHVFCLFTMFWFFDIVVFIFVYVLGFLFCWFLPVWLGEINNDCLNALMCCDFLVYYLVYPLQCFDLFFLVIMAYTVIVK